MNSYICNQAQSQCINTHRSALTNEPKVLTLPSASDKNIAGVALFHNVSSATLFHILQTLAFLALSDWRRYLKTARMISGMDNAFWVAE